MSTLFVVRVQAVDADGNDLDFEDRQPAAAESDQFEVNLTRPAAHAAELAGGRRRVPARGGAADGDRVRRRPHPAPARVGPGRPGLRRADRQPPRPGPRVPADRSPAAHDGTASPRSPRSARTRRSASPSTPEDAQPRELPLPAGLASRRAKLLQAFAARPVRDLVEVMDWDEDLLSQARGYVQGYRRALDGATPEARAALLAMDTLTVTVGTAVDEVVRGLVLLPTHPLRIAWTAAHDQLTRGWAAEAAQAGKTIAARASLVDFDLVRRLSPANLPFITVDQDGKPFVYAEELTYGSALYLPPSVGEPQSAADVICRVIDVQHDSVDLTVSADALGGRLRSYRDAHPGAGAMRIMAVNPGSGALLRKALTPLVLPKTPDDETPRRRPAAPGDRRLQRPALLHRAGRRPASAAAVRRLGRATARRHSPHSPARPRRPRSRAADQDREGHHVAVVQDLARADVTDPLVTVPDPRSTAFRDLLTTLSCEPADDGSGTWSVLPALKPRGSGRMSRHRRRAPHPPGRRRRPARTARFAARPDDPPRRGRP